MVGRGFAASLWFRGKNTSKFRHILNIFLRITSSRDNNVSEFKTLRNSPKISAIPKEKN